MGKWFLDFSFWTLGYMTVQTAHCAMGFLLDKAPRLVFILILLILIFVKFNQTAHTGTTILSSFYQLSFPTMYLAEHYKSPSGG